jgi:hypothetical protein
MTQSTRRKSRITKSLLVLSPSPCSNIVPRWKYSSSHAIVLSTVLTLTTMDRMFENALACPSDNGTVFLGYSSSSLVLAL